MNMESVQKCHSEADTSDQIEMKKDFIIVSSTNKCNFTATENQNIIWFHLW